MSDVRIIKRGRIARTGDRQNEEKTERQATRELAAVVQNWITEQQRRKRVEERRLASLLK